MSAGPVRAEMEDSPESGLILPDQNAGQPLDTENPDTEAVRSALMKAVNKARNLHGLPPLEWSEMLYRTAQVHAADMAALDFFSHYNPVNEAHKSLDQRIFLFGKPRGPYSENISMEPAYRISPDQKILPPSKRKPGFRDEKGNPLIPHSPVSIAALITDTWMNSPDSRVNILSEDFRITGISVIAYTDKKSKMTFFKTVQVFGVTAEETK